MQNIFPIVYWTSKYVIYKFSCKNVESVSRSKFLASRTKGHCRTNLNEFFFFSSKRFFHFFLEHLYICYLQVFMQKMQKLFSGQNSWPLGPKGIFEQDLIDFPAPPSNDFSICFMDLLNMLYTSFVQNPRHCTPIKIIGK